QREAKAIADRFEQGFKTVLLADEVGMGKTYAALAVMADYVFQTEENNRKVLLVVPTGSVLLDKWEQEITTFSKRYLNPAVAGGGRKTLRPHRIGTLSELFFCLNDYLKIDVERASGVEVRLFARCFKEWHVRRKGKDRTPFLKSEMLKFAIGQSGWETFCAKFSPAIADIFFDRVNAVQEKRIRDLAAHLADNGIYRQEQAFKTLKAMLKEFASLQDALEPNVLLVSTGMLGRGLGRESKWTRPLGLYVASRLVFGKHDKEKWLVDAACCGIVEHGTRLVDVEPFTKSNFYGLEQAVDFALNDSVQKAIRKHAPRLLEDAIFASILGAQLDRAGIGLAVVDEVHNWRSGTTNGAGRFRTLWAPRISRRLVMSATPFQIDKGELRNVFTVASGLKRKGQGEKSDDMSMQAVEKAMAPGGPADAALRASERFEASWKELSAHDISELEKGLSQDQDRERDKADGCREADVRSRLKGFLQRLASGATASSALQAFAARALAYREKLDGFESALRDVVIRHTRDRAIRGWHCGGQYQRCGLPAEPRRNVVYETEGLAPEGGDMVAFVGMRAQQLLSRALTGSDKERVYLLGGLNSSYEAFRESWDNAGLGRLQLAATGEARAYLDFFLEDLVKNGVHPKVKASCDRAVANYHEHRKTLVFCSRLKTQKALRDRILEELRFDKPMLSRMRTRVLEDFAYVDFYLSRSLACARGRQLDAAAVDLEQIRSDMLAAMGWMGGERFTERRLMRLADLSLARRLFPACRFTKLLDERHRDALRHLLWGRTRWNAPSESSASVEDAQEEQAMGREEAKAPELSLETLKRLVCGICSGPSIWHAGGNAGELHDALQRLLESEASQIDEGLQSGASQEDAGAFTLAKLLVDVPRGLRKVLLRMDRMQGMEGCLENYGKTMVDLLVSRSLEPRSAWQQTVKFAKMLADEEGSILPDAAKSRRLRLWRGVFLSQQDDGGAVAMLNGAVDTERRSNLCAAFNSPLLPDILICTAIGSEGIDLHLACQDVIHHDLPWNPALLEQRTGRVDRVGSLALRSTGTERVIASGVPFLAHDYDTFQYETVLARAQKQEILLGCPDFSKDAFEEKEDRNGNVAVAETDADQGARLGQECRGLPKDLLSFFQVDLSLKDQH
ncbi:MAG: DEAD/DEAH box helicase family protein, partial [Desulfovibrio sp.]|nr:DEAD/DEAH box helicase family protein [Desulfovibrio sp.]